MECISRHVFDTQAIVNQYPAELYDRNKEIVFELSSPQGATHAGEMSFSRWRQEPLPEAVTRSASHPRFERRDGFFTYDTPAEGRMDWHVNFANDDLFSAYGTSLFAQDEMQVAEHPALASLRHALFDVGIKPRTVENDTATPALIMGVERRCSIVTDPDPAEGRPDGLYGNNFALATEDAIRRATKVIAPPTISNILAMEASPYGVGRYTREEIEFILATAITGFSAAVHESKSRVSPDVRIAIHTGYWGCGAYGGNRELMPLLQMIAACASDVDMLVFYAGPDSEGYDKAMGALDDLLHEDQPVSCDELLSQIESIGFAWGVSDGN